MGHKGEIIAVDNCNYARLASKISRLEEKVEKVNKFVQDTELHIKEANKVLDLVRLAKQMYELVILEETYVATLEEAVENEIDNIPLISSLQKSTEIRDIRSKAAVRLCTDLMRDKMKASQLF